MSPKNTESSYQYSNGGIPKVGDLIASRVAPRIPMGASIYFVMSFDKKFVRLYSLKSRKKFNLALSGIIYYYLIQRM